MRDIYYQDNHIKIFNKDCRVMDELEDNSVQCVVTSPPYWGLRKYSGEQDLIWGDKDCEHQWGKPIKLGEGYTGSKRWQHLGGRVDEEEHWAKSIGSTSFCSLCGAWKGAYGLEPTPEMYVQHTIEILGEIRRVLRKDGVVFWNIGDSYYGSGQGASTNPETLKNAKEVYNIGEKHSKTSSILKPKDLCLIPFRVAIAAQEDGWWVRSVIIWSKPNPMPESVTDRPTESHEYILMLTKNSKYYWDADAVREENAEPKGSGGWQNAIKQNDPDRYKGQYLPKKTEGGAGGSKFMRGEHVQSGGRNIRSVWEFPTQPYPEAHFAVFPEKLPELCIKAATSEKGCCSKCGAPWERVVESKQYPRHNTEPHDLATDGDGANRGKHAKSTETQTLGWQPTCKCNAEVKPCLVVDPFMGVGTTLWVAKKLNRKAVGYDISEEYCQLAADRNRQGVML